MVQTSQTRVIGNILHCLQNGTSLGWLIDPEEKSVLVFLPKNQPQLLTESDEILTVPDKIAQLHLTVGDLFAWLKL